jgi:hypothetical protein
VSLSLDVSPSSGLSLSSEVAFSLSFELLSFSRSVVVFSPLLSVPPEPVQPATASVPPASASSTRRSMARIVGIAVSGWRL